MAAGNVKRAGLAALWRRRPATPAATTGPARLDWAKRFASELAVETAVAPDDEMLAPGHERHYFAVGRSAVVVLATALTARLGYAGGDEPIASILDFGCGHGRVARFLRAAFPDARIAVTDYNARGSRWCVEHFGCVEMGAAIPTGAYDLVWLGSVLTHLPEAVARPLLAALAAALRPTGLLVFSSQGRFAARRIEEYFARGESGRPYVHYQLEREAALEVVRGYRDAGFGYVDYPGRSGYGVALVDRAWFNRALLAGEDLVEAMWQEKAWDAHQDVSAYLRADLLDERKGWYY